MTAAGPSAPVAPAPVAPTPACPAPAGTALAARTALAALTATAQRRLECSSAEARWIAEEAGRSPDPTAAMEEMVRRLRAGEPLQYVLGSWDFRTIRLAVDRRALIPRPETEQVVEVGLREACGARLVADVGTGSGAIACSLATELPAATVWATDVDAAALALAADNVSALPPPVAARVRLAAGEWFEALPVQLVGRFDLIVSNPPYVSESEWESLEPVVRCEPRTAIVAADGSEGTPGMAAVEAVLGGASRWLRPGGAVVVELSPHQAGPAAALAAASGYSAVRIEPDLAGRERAVVARR